MCKSRSIPADDGCSAVVQPVGRRTGAGGSLGPGVQGKSTEPVVHTLSWRFLSSSEVGPGQGRVVTLEPTHLIEGSGVSGLGFLSELSAWDFGRLLEFPVLVLSSVYVSYTHPHPLPPQGGVSVGPLSPEVRPIPSLPVPNRPLSNGKSSCVLGVGRSFPDRYGLHTHPMTRPKI